jgi:hypothetical protein
MSEGGVEGLSHITLIARDLDRMTAIVESMRPATTPSPSPAKNSSTWAGSGSP